MAMGVSENSSSTPDPHQHGFPDPTPGADVYAFYVTLSLFSVIGIVGNVLAFIIFFRHRNTATSVIFILALAGTDFITCLVTVPFTMVVEALDFHVYYDAPCKIYMFLITSTIPYSSFIMTVIALDRYFFVCHPLRRVFTVNRARIVVLALAIPAFCFGIITGLSVSVYRHRQHLIFNGSVLLGTNITKATVLAHKTNMPMINVTDLDSNPNGQVLETELPFLNHSRIWVLQKLEHHGMCIDNAAHVSYAFKKAFHYLYTSCYAVCFIVVTVLYILIYKTIYSRQSMVILRRRRPDTPEETAMTVINDHKVAGTTATSAEMSLTDDDSIRDDGRNTKGTRNDGNGVEVTRDSTRPAGSEDKEGRWSSHIKTAMMLFVVTFVFLLAFLPAWLMAHGILPYQMNIFYMYFVYNVANPFIYAFMNHSFRDDLKKLFRRS